MSLCELHKQTRPPVRRGYFCIVILVIVNACCWVGFWTLKLLFVGVVRMTWGVPSLKKETTLKSGDTTADTSLLSDGSRITG